MKLSSRLGKLEIAPDSLLRFPTGVLGAEDCRRWALVADQRNEALVWLQSLDRPELTFALVSPRRFLPSYQIRVARRELVSLELDDPRMAHTLVIVGRNSRGLTLNLKAPILINPARQIGRQVITNGELPVRYELGTPWEVMRRSA